jgi:hypothetical protein
MNGLGAATLSPATGNGFAEATGFDPAGGKEIYALMLRNGSGPISPSDHLMLSVIVQDINGANSFPASVGVTASLVSSTYPAEFPGYDILLTSSSAFAGESASQLNFNFSSLGTVNSADSGISVTSIAAVSESAVPEPAGMMGIIAGFSALTLRQRRRAE